MRRHRGEPEEPNIIEVINRRGRVYTSSYDVEKAALLAATLWLSTNQCDNHQALICTDSQSLCSAHQKESADTGTIRQLLSTNRGKVTKPWVPGHVDILGNELTDQHAEEAAHN